MFPINKRKNKERSSGLPVSLCVSCSLSFFGCFMSPFVSSGSFVSLFGMLCLFQSLCLFVFVLCLCVSLWYCFVPLCLSVSLCLSLWTSSYCYMLNLLNLPSDNTAELTMKNEKCEAFPQKNKGFNTNEE